MKQTDAFQRFDRKGVLQLGITTKIVFDSVREVTQNENLVIT